MSAVPVFARDVLQVGAEGFGKLNAAAALGGSLALIGCGWSLGHVRREPMLGGASSFTAARFGALGDPRLWR